MSNGLAVLEALYRVGSRRRVVFDGAEEQAAITWEKSMGFRKRGDERNFGDHYSYRLCK
jgi:hypothetical protein